MFVHPCVVPVHTLHVRVWLASSPHSYPPAQQQAVFARQKQSYIDQLTKADAARQQLVATVQQLEDQLVRATTEVQQRRQADADKGEDADRQLSLLRKVCVVVCFQCQIAV